MLSSFLHFLEHILPTGKCPNCGCSKCPGCEERPDDIYMASGHAFAPDFEYGGFIDECEEMFGTHLPECEEYNRKYGKKKKTP